MKICKTCFNEFGSPGKECYKCQKKRYRKKYPIKSSFHNLKASAKKRGIPFSLTLKQFTKFCKETTYLTMKGIYKDSLHVDRIIESEGYYYENIQALPNTDNVKKYCAYIGTVEGKKIYKTITNKTTDNEKDLPF